MLVLSRKVGEQILVGKGVVITILEHRGSRVRIGIDAPDYMTVLRKELKAVSLPRRVRSPAVAYPGSNDAITFPPTEEPHNAKSEGNGQSHRDREECE